MDAPQNLAPATRLLIGLLFVAAGLMPMLAAFDIGPLNRSDINGPPWLGFVAGGMFFLAGLTILAGPLPELVNRVLAVVLMVGLAAIGNWVAFGAGERVCSGGVALPFLWSEGTLSDLGCRIPFGIGALIANAVVCVFAAVAMQKALGGPPRLARLVKAAEWILLASLLPIILPLLVFGIASAAAGALVTRAKTGRWPRNEEFIARQKAKGLKLGRWRQDD